MTFESANYLEHKKKSYGTMNDNYADKIIGTTSIYMYNEKNIIKLIRYFIKY